MATYFYRLHTFCPTYPYLSVFYRHDFPKSLTFISQPLPIQFNHPTSPQRLLFFENPLITVPLDDVNNLPTPTTAYQ